MRQECEGKYGKLRCVLVHVNPLVEKDAVRVFVEFEDKAAAAKAFEALDGRFFGGRCVRASYFDEARFAKRDIA